MPFSSVDHLPVPEQKRILRPFFRQIRDGIPAHIREQKAKAAAERFLADIPVAAGQIVAGYAAIHSEMDVLPLLRHLIGKGAVGALPRMTGDIVEFLPWHITDRLHTDNSLHIPQPELGSTQLIPDIIITPLLACDKKGTRLGYGKGFYDKTFSMLHEQKFSPLKVAIAFDAQFTDTLPKAPFDQPVDVLVTEERTIWFK